MWKIHKRVQVVTTITKINVPELNIKVLLMATAASCSSFDMTFTVPLLASSRNTCTRLHTASAISKYTKDVQ